MAHGDEMPSDLDWAAIVAERKIQEAREEGVFDNLPGRGKPLDLRRDPFESVGAAIVNRILKHNNVMPIWVTLEQEIEHEREQALSVLSRWEEIESKVRNDARYTEFRSLARVTYAAHMKRTNDLILKYNVNSPFALRAPIPFMQKRRLAEFDERYGTGAEPPASALVKGDEL